MCKRQVLRWLVPNWAEPATHPYTTVGAVATRLGHSTYTRADLPTIESDPYWFGPGGSAQIAELALLGGSSRHNP